MQTKDSILTRGKKESGRRVPEENTSSSTSTCPSWTCLLCLPSPILPPCSTLISLDSGRVRRESTHPSLRHKSDLIRTRVVPRISTGKGDKRPDAPGYARRVTKSTANEEACPLPESAWLWLTTPRNPFRLMRHEETPLGIGRKASLLFQQDHGTEQPFSSLPACTKSCPSARSPYQAGRGELHSQSLINRSQHSKTSSKEKLPFSENHNMS